MGALSRLLSNSTLRHATLNVDGLSLDARALLGTEQGALEPLVSVLSTCVEETKDMIVNVRPFNLLNAVYAFLKGTRVNDTTSLKLRKM